MKKMFLIFAMLFCVCNAFGQLFNFSQEDPQAPTPDFNDVWPQLEKGSDDVWLMTKFNEQVHTALWNNNTPNNINDDDIDINQSFTIQFELLFSGLPNDEGADGIAFVLRSPSSTKLLGGKGGAIGYLDIQESFGVEFDTYCNNS